MAIRVEFYGVARQRTGVASVEVPLAAPVTLGDCLLALGDRFPSFARDCLDKRQLKTPFAANVGGERFLSNSDETLEDGDALLILSADAGG
jgi:molybdopterin converting factor small subunit